MAGADRRRAGAVSRRLRPVQEPPGARGSTAAPAGRTAGSRRFSADGCGSPAPGQGAPAERLRPKHQPERDLPPNAERQPGPAGLQNPYGRYFSAPRSFEQLVRARRGKGGQPR